MKTKITLFIIVMLGLMGPAMANTADSLFVRQSPEQTIRNAIVYPGHAAERGIEGTVSLRLEVLQNGELRILQSNYSSRDLYDYVHEALDAMRLDPLKYRTGEPFDMSFRFELFK